MPCVCGVVGYAGEGTQRVSAVAAVPEYYVVVIIAVMMVPAGRPVSAHSRSRSPAIPFDNV